MRRATRLRRIPTRRLNRVASRRVARIRFAARDPWRVRARGLFRRARSVARPALAPDDALSPTNDATRTARDVTSLLVDRAHRVSPLTRGARRRVRVRAKTFVISERRRGTSSRATDGILWRISAMLLKPSSPRTPAPRAEGRSRRSAERQKRVAPRGEPRAAGKQGPRVCCWTIAQHRRPRRRRLSATCSSPTRATAGPLAACAQRRHTSSAATACVAAFIVQTGVMRLVGDNHGGDLADEHVRFRKKTSARALPLARRPRPRRRFLSARGEDARGVRAFSRAHMSPLPCRPPPRSSSSGTRRRETHRARIRARSWSPSSARATRAGIRGAAAPRSWRRLDRSAAAQRRRLRPRGGSRCGSSG